MGLGTSPEEKHRLLDFEGYGPDEPDVIFVGLEEYCDPDPERQRDAIFIRCNHPAFNSKRVDKNRATRALTSDGQIPHVPVWRVMAKIMSSLAALKTENEYLALGTRPPLSSISSWLTDLRPLPRPNSNVFRGSYIDEWFGFRNQDDYKRLVEEVAGHRLLGALRISSPPRFAFFYGKPTCDWARRHLSGEIEVPLEEAGDAIEIGQTANGTVVALTGFYSGQHQSAFRSGHTPRLMSRLRYR